MTATTTTTTYASAPGKVILFGEHAVVHGAHAVAASLTSLRVHAMATARSDGIVSVELVDLGENCECSTEALGILSRQGVPKPPATGPRPEVLEVARRTANANAFSSPAAAKTRSRLGLSSSADEASSAVVAALYLCAELCDVGGVTLRVRSAGLPLGAGLGSSAAFGVATAAALCGSVVNEEVVNGWAFAAEVISHGAPSGLDNAVCCFGGGSLAVRRDGALRASRLPLPSLALLVVDTKKPRKTSRLVADVGELLRRVDQPVRRVFDAVDAISRDFAEACSSSSCESFSRRAADWMVLNHALLRALGVSDPVLEEVADVAQSHGAAATKLTGAGGGGCAITLLHDAKTFQRLDAARVAALVAALRARGFASYETDLGGPGVQVAATPLPDSPFHRRRRPSVSSSRASSLVALAAAAALLCAFAAARRR